MIKDVIDLIKSSYTEQELNFLTDTQFRNLLLKANKMGKEKLKGGLADDRPDSKYNPKELAMGIKVEMEHTNDPEKAKEIAKDHLETCGFYYTHLKEMEDKYCEDH